MSIDTLMDYGSVINVLGTLRHSSILPPNYVAAGHADEGAVFISSHLSTKISPESESHVASAACEIYENNVYQDFGSNLASKPAEKRRTCLPQVN